MKTPQILVVDDDLPMRTLIKKSFLSEGYCVYETSTGDEMLQILREQSIDLVVLAVDLAEKNGLFLARTVREESDVALFLITDHYNEVDKILALEIGADAYLSKACHSRELTIRARNVLARTLVQEGSPTSRHRHPPEAVSLYTFHGWTFDVNQRCLVSPIGEGFKLPKGQFRAILQFCEEPGKIHSRASLLKRMTGRDLKPMDRTVDVSIRRIRRYFESYPHTPKLIVTIHGEGYRFCGDVVPSKH